MSQKIKMSLNDASQRFLFEDNAVRGVVVHLTQSFQTILKQHAYPKPIQKYLGEMILSAALLVETIKLEGRLTIQFQSDSAIKMLVAQINDQGQLRALAQWDNTATIKELESGLGRGSLVMTIFQNKQSQPMQSVVPLEHKTIAEALSFYFLQSEQLPTIFSFAVDQEKASGFLLQMMPAQNQEDCENHWRELVNTVNTIDARELFYDNNISFLQHYFPKENIRIFDSRDLAFHCGCTVEKMGNAILLMGHQEANLILKDQSEIVVTCEYCNQEYAFDREQVEDLFRKK